MESRSSNMMVVQGSQLKRDDPIPMSIPMNKEMGRVQSMKPIAEPLINSKQPDINKSSYWRGANSNMQDDGAATVLLEKQRINADISVTEGYQ